MAEYHGEVGEFLFPVNDISLDSSRAIATCDCTG